jgi:hypothetical protein
VKHLLFAVGVFAMMLPSGIGLASECGNLGNANILRFEGWSAEKRDFLIDLTLRYRSEASAPIKMVDGAIWFTDVLGGSLGGFDIERDLHIPPGASYEQHLRVTEDRFLKASPADIVGIACVKAVLYEDGAKASFATE